MRVTVLAFGTRGDIQTALALGVGLQQAGHTVQMVTQATFCDLVQSYGVHCVPIAADVRLPSQKEAKTGKLSVYDQYRLARRYLQEALEGVWKASQQAEALVFSDWGRIPGIHIVEKLNIPAFMSLGHPLQMCFLYPETNVYGPAWRCLDSRLRKMALWHLGLNRSINTWRQKTLGLPKTTFWKSETEIKRRQIPLFYAHSPLVFPKPPTWPAWLHVTGYWFLDLPQTWNPPDDLVNFLSAGSPPLCIGFSSMTNRKVRALADPILQALAQTGLRAVLLSGWSDLGQTRALPSTAYAIDRLPHDWLFPRVSAVVHHGGPGTLAAAIRAGVPSVVIPFALDQPFWGARVETLRIGSALNYKSLTAERLAQALLSAVRDPAIRERAADLGRQVRAEDGVANAVGLFEQYVRKG